MCRLPQMLLTLACLLLLQVSAASAAPTVTDCKGALEPSIYNGCDGVSFVGCCDALGRQLWCQGDHLYCVDCNDGFPA